MAIETPTAGIVVYSYKDRGGSNADVFDHSVDTLYITKSIISINTVKHKSRPSGNFEVVLAPSKNWIAAISPGSWIEIHMSPRKMSISDLQSSSIKTLKMIGFIDSVRINVSVDQSSGARMTTYSLTGRDWGGAFESHLYVDSTAQTNSDNALQAALKPFYSNVVSGLYSTTQLVNLIIGAWGTTMALTPSNSPKNLDKLSPQAVYSIPQQLALKLGNPALNGKNLAKLIDIKSGYLSGYDKYSDTQESVGLFNTQGLIGINTVWQLLNGHMNNIINELVCDLRWDGEQPKLTLYKRIKPFKIKDQPFKIKDDNIYKTYSSFFDLKRHEININHVINFSAGDNAEDIINFIEIMPDLSIYSLSQAEQIGILSAAKQKNSRVKVGMISRHGIKPLIYSTNFTPNRAGVKSWDLLSNWLPILQHWYFDCHKMLNGTLSIIGQDSYISVGDNVAIDAKILGNTSYVAGYPSKLLAHIESVQHTFHVHETGAKSFFTNISFIRGIMTDNSASKLIGIDAYGIETLSDKVTEENRNIKNTYIE